VWSSVNKYPSGGQLALLKSEFLSRAMPFRKLSIAKSENLFDENS
jgi:hypothetical protein